ncbi:MAG TPA: TatD family hydrolase [Alphaproteobacteria bacterium]|nr:TatD family hydrolase [Alphaproteobacteria bacterium]
MFIDTHCHLTDRYAKPDELDAIINHAKDAGVGTLICACAEPVDFEPAIEIIKKYKNVFCTIGVHPEHLGSLSDVILPDSIIENPKVLGVGEIGLEYHYGSEHKKQQIELFEKQLAIAKKHNLPVAIHTREAEEDTMAILDGSVRGVMHCFTGSWEFAKVMLDRGFFISASGILTFKNSMDLRETFSKIPTDRIVIETDSPWCAPIPFRGKPCQPAMVIETAKVLAEIKKLQISELETILMENTKNLYPKIKL